MERERERGDVSSSLLLLLLLSFPLLTPIPPISPLLSDHPPPPPPFSRTFLWKAGSTVTSTHLKPLLCPPPLSVFGRCVCIIVIIDMMTIHPYFWISFFMRDNALFFSFFGISAASCFWKQPVEIQGLRESESSGSGLCKRRASDCSVRPTTEERKNHIIV